MFPYLAYILLTDDFFEVFVTRAVGPAAGGPDQTVLPGSVLGIPAHPVRVEHGAAPPQGKPGAIPIAPSHAGRDSVKIRLACLSVYTGS